MEITAGRFAVLLERPQTEKFAWPILLLPELFATHRHLSVLAGYLSTIGWTVYVPQFHSAAALSGHSGTGFTDALAMVEEVLQALGSGAIVAGHGLGGLLALKLAERPGVRAAVAFAPLVPGFSSPLFSRARNFVALRRGGRLSPPSGRALFEFVADADAFQRPQLIAELVRDSGAIAREVARGEISFAQTGVAPRLIIAGGADIFAPRDQMVRFAATVGAKLVMLDGRGHWLVGGRALERAIAETQRFLVQSLGRELLLLYQDGPGGSDA